MTYDEAVKVLGTKACLPDGLHQGSPWISWTICEELVCVDGEFSADELEAIAVYMRSLGQESK